LKRGFNAGIYPYSGTRSAAGGFYLPAAGRAKKLFEMRSGLIFGEWR